MPELLLLPAAAYLWALARCRGAWPARRTVSWFAGLAAIAAVTAGPPAHDYVRHMVLHLVAGMGAPLLLVLGAPGTLAVRALPVRPARRLSGVLRSVPVRVITHPVPAALLDLGGIALIYLTPLYHRAPHLLVVLHLVIAGYLFTNAMIGLDPAPHRPGPATRAAVLIAFLAAHGILAKYLYAHPPAGVTGAQRGAMVMYYGGDLLHLALITIFCAQWYGVRIPPRAWRLPAGV